MSDDIKTTPLPKVFAFINGGSPGLLNVVALAEDGHALAGHCSSTERWASYDISSDYYRERYAAHYPDGYELLDYCHLSFAETSAIPVFMDAVRKSQATAAANSSEATDNA